MQTPGAQLDFGILFTYTNIGLFNLFDLIDWIWTIQRKKEAKAAYYMRTQTVSDLKIDVSMQEARSWKE